MSTASMSQAGSQYSHGGKRSNRPGSTSTSVSIVSTHPVPYVSNQYKSQINSTSFGPGKQQMCYAVICFVVSVVFLAVGATFLGLRQQGQLYVSDQTEFIGPLLIALAFVAVGIGVYFVVRARKSSNQARANVRFHPDGMNGSTATASINGGAYVNDSTSVAAVSMASASRTGTSMGGSRGGSILMEQPQEELLSGSVTAKGVRAGPRVNTQPAPTRIPDEQRRYRSHRNQGQDYPDQMPRNPQVAQVKKEATF